MFKKGLQTLKSTKLWNKNEILNNKINYNQIDLEKLNFPINLKKGKVIINKEIKVIENKQNYNYNIKNDNSLCQILLKNDKFPIKY